MPPPVPARSDRAAVVPTLLTAQLVFNVGFYAVVPFLAGHLHDGLAASGTTVAVVLAVRTFGQQGLFVVGGSLADRYGARRVMVAGTAVRVAGYLGLAMAGSVPALIGAAVLTGAGGALFSPALESLLAAAGDDTGRRSRTRLFALLAVCGETGAVLGPVAGALLTGAGFPTMAATGAAVFAVAGVALWLALPADRPAAQARRPVPSWRAAVTDRPFLVFCLAYSSYLVSYQQLYTALPVELDRVGATDTVLAALFLGAAVLIVVGQLPVQRCAARRSPGTSLSVGFGLMAAGFLVVAGFAPTAPAGGPAAILPAGGLVALLTAGQMVVVPVAMGQVPRFAGHHPSGAYFGLLATAGGCAVLLSALLIGPFLDAGRSPAPVARIPWLLMAALPAASAAAMPVILRSRPRTA